MNRLTKDFIDRYVEKPPKKDKAVAEMIKALGRSVGVDDDQVWLAIDDRGENNMPPSIRERICKDTANQFGGYSPTVLDIPAHYVEYRAGIFQERGWVLACGWTYDAYYWCLVVAKKDKEFWKDYLRSVASEPIEV